MGYNVGGCGGNSSLFCILIILLLLCSCGNSFYGADQ
ncbi:hypothetical protein Desru_2958 [Desulforamulus ruminis DSM 2154]|uniref:Uncharacterized protein n=1 Tax=Desulforamulus ruminis (strain ATCC 23193 / DSM 2154 / NCIMB 8452 / DL) TaxID=696281 RepID=F6DT66_DESRL|nr:hypothetical protein Desru_2958 [Desulforamulus ruminis DSM 2154]